MRVITDTTMTRSALLARMREVGITGETATAVLDRMWHHRIIEWSGMADGQPLYRVRVPVALYGR